MPTETAIANRRVLRLALGTSLSLWFSQAMAWDLSFIAPVFTLVLLSTPAPAPGLKKGVVLVLALVLPVMLASIVLIPFFLYLHSVAVLLVGIALFYSFYLPARGGPAAIGTLLSMSITIVVAIGSVNSAALSAINQALALGAASGIAFVWIAHALLPEIKMPGKAAQKPAAEKPSTDEALRLSLRALLVVLPIAIFMLFSPSSTSYVVVMIKAASMGQQSEYSDSKDMGRSLIESTVWGGLGAIIAWQILSIWPSLFFYALIMCIAGLQFGRRIFHGRGMHPKGAMWSYALLTMIVLIAPAVLDSANSAPAGAAFWSRLMLIGATALYGSLAVMIFDAFWPESKPSERSISVDRTNQPVREGQERVG